MPYATNIQFFRRMALLIFLIFASSSLQAQEDCAWEEAGNNRQLPLILLAQQPLHGDKAASGRVQNWLRVSVALIERGGEYYLQIYTEIDDLAEKWGEIPANSPCLLQSTRKERPIKLRTLRGAQPIEAQKSKDAEASERIAYNCVYALRPRDLRRLRKMEVGSLQMQWLSAGEWEIMLYDVDAMKQLLRCVE